MENSVSNEFSQKKENYNPLIEPSDKSNVSTKCKAKSYRPIILLRRNSYGNVVSNQRLVKGPVGMPRLKSMPEIKRKIEQLENISDKAYLSQVKKEQNSELSSSTTTTTKTRNSLCLASTADEMHIKTEVVENATPSPWVCEKRQNIAQKQHTWQPGSFPANAASGVDFLKSGSVFQNTQCLPTQSTNFMKQDSVAFPQCNQINVTPFCNSQHFQNIRPMSAPLNNTGINPFIPDRHDHFSGLQSAPNRQYFLSPVTQHQADVMDVSIPVNRSVFYPVNPIQSTVSEGAIMQPFPTSSQAFQMQSTPVRQNNCGNVQLTSQSQSIQAKYFESSATDDSLTNITWLGRMGVNNFMPVPLEKERKGVERNDKHGRPPYSYMALIQFAINSSKGGRMTLRQIYQWIEEKFPYFKTAKPGWKNSIRHNLSLHDLFVREVTTGSKISYWTLRPDLNIRPLTLDSVAASSQGPVWSLQGGGQGQKPILPRLPYCSRPYILLPVPIMQSNKEGKAAEKTALCDHSETYGQDASSSSSLFADSGFNSDLSQCALGSASKSYSAFSSETGSLLHNESSSILLKTNESIDEPSPLLSQSNVNITGSGKRPRKQPMKTLNDSLNSSLNFLKDEMNSPPARRQLSPSGEQFLLCKKASKKSKKKETCFMPRSSAVGLSDESFSELLNDLGSPFKSYLTHNTASNLSPKLDTARKRRRSWGSPESSNSGPDFQHKLRAANERTPSGKIVRRVKSEAGDLAKAGKDEDQYLPSSTPLQPDKLRKHSARRLMKKDQSKNKENVHLSNHTPKKKRNTFGKPSDTSLILIASPIRNNKGNSEDENDFFQDIIGSVFKTPDKASAPVRHFANLSPEHRPPFADVTPCVNDFLINPRAASGSGPDCPLGVFPSLSPSKDEPLNTSFSKLLDISGGNNSFTRLNNNFPDDLNLSWSNLPNF